MLSADLRSRSLAEPYIQVSYAKRVRCVDFFHMLLDQFIGPLIALPRLDDLSQQIRLRRIPHQVGNLLSLVIINFEGLVIFGVFDQ